MISTFSRDNKMRSGLFKTKATKIVHSFYCDFLSSTIWKRSGDRAIALLNPYFTTQPTIRWRTVCETKTKMEINLKLWNVQSDFNEILYNESGDIENLSFEFG